MQLYAIVKNVKTEAETMRNEAVFLGATNVQVLDRGLDLIELLATAEHGMTISELVAATGLPKSTVHRILARTNADRLIGREALVTEPIDDLRATGAVRVDGVLWTARSETGANIPENAVVTITRIEGAKLFVRPVEVPVETL